MMTLLARDGRWSKALAQYEDCRQLLERELGVEPSARTQALQAAILAGEVEEAGGDL